MINIAICEDNENYLKHIYQMISSICKTHNIDITLTTFDSGEKIIDFLETHPDFDLLFLDIIMGNINGIEVAQYIRKKNSDQPIIFTTSNSEYALEGYDVQAFGYLLKPYDAIKLEQLILKATKQIMNLKSNIFVCKSGQNIHTLQLKDIIYFESERRKITIYLSNQTQLDFYGKLDDINVTLSDKQFIRCHKSFLINPYYIKSIESYSVIMTTDEKLPISRKYLQLVKDKFLNYLQSLI